VIPSLAMQQVQDRARQVISVSLLYDALFFNRVSADTPPRILMLSSKDLACL